MLLKPWRSESLSSSISRSTPVKLPLCSGDAPDPFREESPRDENSSINIRRGGAVSGSMLPRKSGMAKQYHGAPEEDLLPDFTNQLT